MGRLNGIGTVHLGVEEPLGDGSVWATLWVTVLFLPILPLRRERLQLFAHHGTGYACRVLERGSLRLPRVLRSYLFCWLGVPLAVGFPLPLLVSEVWREQLGLSSSAQTIAIVAWIGWLIAWVWGLAEWHERRLRPRSSPSVAASR